MTENALFMRRKQVWQGLLCKCQVIKRAINPIRNDSKCLVYEEKTKRNQGKKNFGSKKILGEKKLGLKENWAQKNLGP